MIDEIKININTNTLDGYKTFIKCKTLPKYKIIGNTIITDKISYNYIFENGKKEIVNHNICKHEFDYQKYAIEKALERERFALYAECGLGKTVVELSFAHDVVNYTKGKAIILCPLGVLEDMQRECERLYGYRLSNLRKDKWITPIALMNYEGMKDIDMRNVDAIILDESSILKNGDGETRKYLTELASNIRFRLACSATPSPNDQTEYASHSVWLGYSSTLKEYYSNYFIKDGTEWKMKRHAQDAFYNNLSSWACYIQSPSLLGFEKGAELNYEPNYIVQNSMVDKKYMKNGNFLSNNIDMKMANKLFTELRSDKTQDRFKKAIDYIQNKRTIVWCTRNKEEELFKKELNGHVINGSTPIERRVELQDAFRNGDINILISKPQVMGFGVNLPQAECHLYSGYTFSFEEFYQAVRRSHRYGRNGILDVVVPVSEPETPVWNILQSKLKTFKKDVIELQKRFFNK